jgi:hypothetical protein
MKESLEVTGRFTDNTGSFVVNEMSVGGFRIDKHLHCRYTCIQKNGRVFM